MYRIFNKTTKRCKNKVVKVYFCFGIPLYKKMYTSQSKSYFVCGIKLLSKKISDTQIKYTVFYVFRFCRNLKKNIDMFMENKRKNVLYFDHSLGGGTEIYSKRQIEKIRKYKNVWHIQYLPSMEVFRVVLIDQKRNHEVIFQKLEQIKNFIFNAEIDEIIVNNLVSYNSTLDVLDYIKEIKEKHKNKIWVSVRGHDFQSICASYNLLNSNNEYCGIPDIKVCEKCIKKVKLAESKRNQEILMSGVKEIRDWRERWQSFYKNIADELVIFNPSIREIFLKAYPFLDQKIKIIPHETNQYRQVKIISHKGINIAFLGNLNSVAKGREIVKKMAQEVRKNKAVSLYVIGSLDNVSNITCTGKYKSSDLPDIVEKLNIDLIFIPSVWPETFSYTTSEAMQMGIPVACFNLGAPADRVKNYEKGLIVSAINAKTALVEICNFIKKQKNGD